MTELTSKKPLNVNNILNNKNIIFCENKLEQIFKEFDNDIRCYKI